jgi:hypothetical protein
MDSIVGTVIFAQESRFQLLDHGGIGHHFVLSHSSVVEPEQLPPLQRAQTRVRVGYRRAPDVLAHLAVSITVLEG